MAGLTMAEPRLELIQIMLQRLLDGQARHETLLRRINEELSLVNRHINAVRRDRSLGFDAHAGASDRMIELDARLARIERRLDLSDT
jgi:hypothetical protein